MSPTSSPSTRPDSARPRCLYQGRLFRQAPLAHGDDRGKPVDVFSCGLHGECIPTRVSDGVACCAVCEQYKPSDDSASAKREPENSVESMVEALRQAPRDWPEDWPYWGTTLEAHRQLAAEYCDQIPPYPEGRYRGRGIVILGGGPFFPGVYVTVRMIRHFGCKLPIEVWHHGSKEPVVPHWLEPFGVRFVDTDRHMDANPEPPRLRGGWASKLYVILHSSFEEVLHLDSDCYPVGDVTPLFDLNTVGSILWPNPAYCDSMINWFAFHSEPSGQPPVNSGVMLVNKAQCWKTLVLAQWWNDHADYVYRHGCGDQDVVRGVWQYRREPWRRFADAPSRAGKVHVDLGPQGTPLFVHRIGDKFRLPCLPIRSSAQDKPVLYKSDPVLGHPKHDATLPEEDVAFQSYRQFIWLLDNDPNRFRPGTLDQLNWHETVDANAYQLPAQLPAESRVIDVGAHIGSFTHLAMRRGAERVWSFEVDPNNFAQCEKHVALWGRRVELRNQAVWHNRGRAGYLPYPENNGAGRVVADGESVETVAIDDVLDEVSEGGTHRIHILKLDCEGSEWPILFHSRRLRWCENIIGEYHPGQWQGKERWPDDLCRLLASQGFTVTIRPFSDRQGLFWATRIE